MLTHYKATTGYAQLYLILMLATISLTGLLAGLAMTLGISMAGKIAAIVIVSAFWVLAFVVMQRFISLENRRPSLWESNLVGVKSVLFFFAALLFVLLIVAILFILGKLIGNLGEVSSGRPGGPGGSGSGRQAGGSEMTDQQKLQAIQGVWGFLTVVLLIYIAPFLNFAFLSRLFKSKTKPAE